MKITKDNFQRIENEISHVDNNKIVSDGSHQAWIIDVGDVDEKTLESVRDTILESLKQYPKLQNNLDATIFSLEQKQKHDYSSMTGLVLSYLYDIKNNKVPSHTLNYYQDHLKKKGNLKS